MTYRSAADALRERTESLESEKAALEATRRAGAALDASARAVQKKLADLAVLRGRFEQKRALPMLDTIAIAAPCSESWDAMAGDDKARFCGKCEKHVYNLSAMSREEAELLMLEREGELCVRLYRRKDGSVMTNDCPVGVRRRRLRLVGAIGIGAGLASSLFGYGAAKTSGVEHSTVMGAFGAYDPPSQVEPPSASNVPSVMGTVAPQAPPAPSSPPRGVPSKPQKRTP